MLTQKQLLELSNGDLVTYLVGGCAKILTPKETTFRYYYVREILANGKLMRISLLDDDNKVSVYPLKDLNFDFTFPDAGYYSNQGEVVSYQQLPIRQNNKIINEHSHKFKSLFNSLCMVVPRSMADAANRVFGPRAFGPSTGLLNRIFIEKDSRPVARRIKDVLSGKYITTPLSLNFAVSLGIFSKYPTLWFKGFPIGEFSTPTQVKINCSIFQQEAIDFLSNHEIFVH